MTGNNSPGSFSVSILLIHKIAGIFSSRIRAINASSGVPTCGMGSTNNNAQSTPSRLSRTTRTIYSPNADRGLCSPGVSINTICVSFLLKTPRMRLRVVCALCVTIAIFSPTSAFVRLDFPTFGRPQTVAMTFFLIILLIS